MEIPSTYEFDAHHRVVDETTGKPFPPLTKHSADTQQQQDETLETMPRSIHAVLLADGIHHQVTDFDLKNLPNRFDTSKGKARYAWFAVKCLAGIGMFIEAYIIITTGQVKTIWYAQYPECWKPTSKQICPNQIACCGLFPNTPEVNGTCIPQQPNVCTVDGTYPDSALCNADLLHSISYAEFAGIMVGMVTFGKIADLIGKVKAGVLTSLLMIVGIAFMSFYSSADASTVFLAFSVAYGVFGWGVGGEYPLTAMSAAAQRLEEKLDAHFDDESRARHRVLVEKAQAARRGETISMAFAMQGVGAVFGSAYLLFLLYFSGQTRSNCDEADIGLNSAGSDPNALNGVWRSFYLLGGTFCLMILLFRWLMEQESQARNELVWRQQQRLKSKSSWQILKFYAPRLIGTGGTWFVLDVAFYGLKLFSGPIFAAINPNGDLIVQNGYLLIYNLCGLVGYYGAAAIMDNPKFGRRRFQMASFGFLTVLFLLTGGIFNMASPPVLIFLFFLSNFASNFGVNTTVYVMAAETYPAEVRGTCHGLSAFSGKLGALVATIIFGKISVQAIFYVCGIVSAVGLLLTFVFGVDLTRVSLAEHDAQFEFFLDGHVEKYQGRLNAYEHLSNWEVWTGRHGQYDPQWAHKLIGSDSKGTSNHVPDGDSDEDHPNDPSNDDDNDIDSEKKV